MTNIGSSYQQLAHDQQWIILPGVGTCPAVSHMTNKGSEDPTMDHVTSSGHMASSESYNQQWVT